MGRKDNKDSRKETSNEIYTTRKSRHSPSLLTQESRGEASKKPSAASVDFAVFQQN